MKISPLAGKPAPPEILVDVPRLISAYYSERPDPSVQSQRVSFGTSGHRGSSFNNSFNENHILAITQAICMYRKQQHVDGPLFLGMDTHGLSVPAHITAIEVLAANGVEVMIAEKDEYTPTPVISHAILTYNNTRKLGLSDGIVITPSHNPPDDGGFKYNPPNGGPAESGITGWIEKKANEILENNLKDVKRMVYSKALKASTNHQYNFLTPYINDLINVVDLKKISDSKMKLGVDPLGGAGVHYWEPIAEHYKLNLTVTEKNVDPTFRFMTVDWDGQIRMDPSSPYAMESLVKLKDKYDISFACDTDHDRHGIVTKSVGLFLPIIIYQFAYFIFLIIVRNGKKKQWLEKRW
ncbi:MAG: phosphoglucomutase [Ginsengibacter sp.]